MPPNRRVVARIVGVVMGALLIYGAFRVFLVVPQAGRLQASSTCMDNLRSLGPLLRDGPPSGTPPGAAWIVGLWRDGSIAADRSSWLVCPGDPDARRPTPETRPPPEGADISALCSYAVRNLARYPVTNDGHDPQTGALAWIACDRNGTDGRTMHHHDGLSVLRGDGSVHFKDREFLGIAEDDPIVVGPDSPHPELRKMVFVPEPDVAGRSDDR